MTGDRPHEGPLVTFGLIEFTLDESAAAGWCPDCKAYSVATGQLHLLSPQGVTLLGPWATCEICDDEEDTDA